MFIFEDVAYGFIPNEAGAAFGHQQLNKLDHFFELRDRNFQKHAAFMDRHKDVFVKAKLLDDVKTSWICYPVQLKPELGWSRRELQVHLEDEGIFTRVIFSGNITRHPMMKGVEYRAAPGGFPVADQIMEQGLMLPCHPTMTDEDCEYLYQVLEDWIETQRRRN
jgi:CDP-6-deoxy-D-xylo-4-hexulose-3-dehydrase